jgi:Do/DeqQ family serine protease
MKNHLLTLLLGLMAGLAGSYIFHKIWVDSSPYPITDRTPALQQWAHYVPSVSGSASYVNGLNAGIDFTVASKVSTNCVVYIKTVSSQEFERYSWFDLFFNDRGTDRRVTGSGSGVIFTSDGYIVTNNHVVDGATKIEVVHNKRTYQATLIGKDPSTDLALIKVEAQGLPAIKVSSSQVVQVGEWVLAVGNPFNLNSTVTAGIVSAKGRRINILEGIFPIESFIQTDAAINPGNSGGALVNLKGELVGINTAILSKTGSYAGYGFAVPSDIVRKIVDDLIKYGEVQKAFAGLEIAEIDMNVSVKMGMDNLDGVLITRVDKDGAAQKAGLEIGDVILQINDYSIDSKADFDEQLSYFSPGDKVRIKYKRGDKNFVREMTLTNIEGTTGIVVRQLYESPRLGATLEALPKLERSRLGIENGIRLAKVERGLIRQMDLQVGDIIVAINNYKLERPEELEEILVKIRGRVYVEVIRKDGRKKVFQYGF